MNTNIMNYGAIADGETLCTQQIQAAIDACYASGGGRVTVPAGNYRSGTIWLKSGIELHLEHGSVIKGSDNLDDYNALDAYEQNFSVREMENWLGKHLIVAHECINVAVTGTGTLDGNGASFMGELHDYSAYAWNEGYRESKDMEKCRPGQMLCFIECSCVTVQDITLTNQPCWGCFLHGCEYVNIRGVKIFNDHTFFCTDGIDIDCCKYVTVSDCIIDTGDDAITLRGAGTCLKHGTAICEHITISNCVLGGKSSAFRIGVGNGLIRHARISNICVMHAGKAIQIMSSYRGRGNVSIDDISFTNLSIANCARPFEITEESQNNATITNVVVENVRAEMYGFFHLNSINADTVKNITLRNWEVKMVDGPKPFTPRCFRLRGTVWFRANNIKRLKMENVSIEDKEGYISSWEDGAFAFENCDDRMFNGFKLNGKDVK